MGDQVVDRCGEVALWCEAKRLTKGRAVECEANAVLGRSMLQCVDASAGACCDGRREGRDVAVEREEVEDAKAPRVTSRARAHAPRPLDE